MSELLKHVAFATSGLTLWHYRTQTNIEVDFIVENRQGQLCGIEVKASTTVDSKDFKGLRHLQETEPELFCQGVVFYAGREVGAFWGQVMGGAVVLLVGMKALFQAA